MTPLASQTLHLNNIHFPSLSTYHTPYASSLDNSVGKITELYEHFSFFSKSLLRILLELPTLYTPESSSVPHPFLTLHPLPLALPQQSTIYNGWPLGLTSVRPTFTYLEHSIPLVINTFILNFLLPVYTTSPPSQHLVLNYFQVTDVFLKPATIYIQQFQPFSKHPNIHLSHHTIRIYIHLTRIETSHNPVSIPH